MELPTITPKQYIASIIFIVPLIWGAFSFIHIPEKKIEDLDKKFTTEIQSVKMSVQVVSNQVTSMKNDRRRDSADSKNDRIETKNEVQEARGDIKEVRTILLNRYPYNQKSIGSN